MPRSNQWLRNAQTANDNNIWHTKPQYINGHAPADNSFTLTRENENGRLSKRGVHSDTASLITRSSWTSRRTEKKSATRCCLILMFIIGAIIIAAAIACLVYFLLSSNLDKSHYGRKGADVSVRLLNKTYTPDMANNRSAAFRSVAVPFCDAMDDYFQRNFSKNYNGCRVVELRDLANREDCVCMTKGGHGLVEVMFELDFEGDVRNVSKKKILDVIWDNTKRIPYENVNYYMINDYLIDIHVAWEASNNGVTADLMIPVYNLTYNKDLEYRNSSRFQYHADLFCNDVDTFFRSSKLRNRYVGCTVNKYNRFPLGVDVELLFNGNETHTIQTDLIKIIMDSAKTVPVSNLKLKLVGDLLVEPWDVDLELYPGLRSTTPVPTTTVKTTTPKPTKPGIEVDKVFKLYNFTYTPGLQFPLSPQFKGISRPFCKDLERLHLLSNYGDFFFECKVYGFGEDPDSIIISVIYKGIKPDDNTILDIIEKGAPRFIEKDKLIYQVGNVLIIANETYFIPTTPSTTPRTTPANITSFHVSTHLPFSDNNQQSSRVNPSDVTSSSSSVHLHSSTESFMSIPSMQHHSSVSSMPSYVENSLANIESSMENSLSNIESSMENSMVSYIESSIYNSMVSHLESSLTSSMEYLEEKSMESSMETNNILYMSSSIDTTTPTTTPSTPPKPTGVTFVELFYRLFDFPYHPDYKDKTSIRFRVLKDEVCQQLMNYLKMNRELDSLFDSCDICINDEDKVTFRLTYSTTSYPQRLSEISMITLARFAPRAEVWPYKLMRVGSLYPIVGSGSPREEVVTVVDPVCSEFPTPPPTPTTALPPKYDTTVARAIYRLYNFTYRPELRDINSEYFKLLERNFCDDIDRFYKSSFLYPSYQHCQINRYGKNPEDVEFDLFFNTEISTRLKDQIDSVLKTLAPRKFFYPPGFSEVETLDIGDLWLILNNRSFILIPRNWTKPTTQAPPTTTPVTAKVTLGYRLYQFPFNPALLDRNSPQFNFYRDAMCEDLRSLYSSSPLFSHLYVSCDLEEFSASPDSLRFNLIFKTEYSKMLEGTVKNALENSRPHLSVPGYKVILVGETYFIINETIKTPAPEITPTPTIVISSTQQLLIYDATNVYLTYEVYNMTDWIDLYDRNSPLFKIYRDKACQDLNEIFRDKTGLLYLTYKECDIERFQKNPLRATFKLTFSQMMSDQLKDTTRRTLEFKAIKKLEDGYYLIKAGDMWLILNRFQISQLPTNYTAPPTPTFMPTSTQVVTTTIHTTIIDSFPTITPSKTYPEMSSTRTPTPIPTTEPPLLYDAVLANITYMLYNFTHTPQHENPYSYEFRKDEYLFCKDVDKVFRSVRSPFVFSYKECRVEDFGTEPNTVRFHIILSEKMREDLRDIIPNTLQGIAPKVNISDYEVMDLGDLYLVIGKYIISVTHHNWTRTTKEPIVITTPQPTTTPKPITPSPTISPVFPTEWVKIQFNANLFNFTWTPELLNPNSRLFRELELAFCNDISKFFSASLVYSAYRGCKIDSFTTNPNEINFKIGFVGPLLGTDIVSIIENNAPRITVQDDNTITAVMDIGGIYLVWKNFTFYIVSPGGLTSYWIPESTVTIPTTTIEPTYVLKLSFRVLNKTYTRGLADKNSEEFKYVGGRFCDSISSMLTSYRMKFPDFVKCEVNAFVKDPMRVNFSLSFIGQQPEETKTRVVGMIVEQSRRININDLYALLIGDLTVAIGGDNMQTMPDGIDPSIDYDGILYNYTFSLYSGNWSQELTNENSQAYRTAVARFCNDIKNLFSRHYLSDRYYDCDIASFGDFNNKEMTVNIVLSGTQDVGDLLILRDVISGNAPREFINGVGWMRIGNLLVQPGSYGGVQYIRFIASPTKPTIPQPTQAEINTYLHISFDLLNLTYSPALKDPNSGLFKFYSRPFCAYLDRVLAQDSRFPSYDKCTVEEFTNNPVTVKFNLKFRGSHTENLQSRITGLLSERAPRAMVNGQIGLVMGNLAIYDQNIAVAQKTVTGNNGPGGSTNNTTNTGTLPLESPCIGTNSIFLPHPYDCEKFYFCGSGQGGVVMDCLPETRFDPVKLVCSAKPPGFVCRPT